MRLVYFENDRGDAISFVAQRIVGIQQNRLPTDTPTTVILLDGQAFRVRNGFDECQQKIMAEEPDMLSALREIASGTYDIWTEGYRAQQIAIAAIAKALG